MLVEGQVAGLNQVILAYLCATTQNLKSGSGLPVLLNGPSRGNGPAKHIGMYTTSDHWCTDAQLLRPVFSLLWICCRIWRMVYRILLVGTRLLLSARRTARLGPREKRWMRLRYWQRVVCFSVSRSLHYSKLKLTCNRHDRIITSLGMLLIIPLCQRQLTS
jgi:hypothetical protein